MAGPWEQYSSAAPPPWEQYTPQQSDPQKDEPGFGTGIGLGVRNLVQGALSIPAAAINGAYGAYNLGADAIQGKGRGDRFQDYNQTVSDALTSWGLPEPKTDAQRVIGAVEQGAAGGAGMLAIPRMLPKAVPVAQRLAQVLGEDAPVRNVTAGGVAGGAAAAAAAAGLPAPAQIAAALLTGAATHQAPAVATGAARGVRSAVAARLAEPLGPEEAGLVRQYEQMGGHLRPGQYSPSNFMRQGDAVVADSPWPRATGFKSGDATRALPAQQNDEFIRMVTHEFGEDAPRITAKVINDAKGRIGDVYKEVLPRNSIRMDDDLAGPMAQIDEEIAAALPGLKPEAAAQISGVMNRIRGQLAEGELPGKLYQIYRQRGGVLDELAGSGSPVLAKAARDMRDALDDAFARQAQGTDGKALQAARAQYRALRTVEPLADKAPTGSISPGLLLGQVVKEYGHPTNAGKLGTLAQVGSAFLKAQPSSGTSERSVWRAIMNKPFSEGIPTAINSAVSLPISAVAGRTINKAINSKEMRARLLADALKDR